ncbi:membrane protein [soil metagenome]
MNTSGVDAALVATASAGILLALLLAIGWYLSYTAVRLDRLHTRLDATDSALDAQLLRRAQTATDLAYSGDLDPASAALVVDAARETLEQSGTWTPARLDSESALTQILGLVSGDLHPGLQVDVEECAMRVRLARTFHNEAVATTRSVRLQPVVRFLHLAGHTDLPEPVEFIDRWEGPDTASAN